MTLQPLISIITVVFNGEMYLEQTIKSVINQTYTNIEYIVIDGGSTDRTLNIIRQYEKHIDYWVSEPDKGLYDAMNKGIGLAKGELIGMINSDDWYELNAVELVVDSYNRNLTKKVFHADRYDILENGNKEVRKFNPSVFKFKYYGMTYNHPSMFVRKDVYIINNYNTNLKSLSDYEFVLKQFLQNKESLKYIPTAYVNYRLDGISAQMSRLMVLKEGFQSRKNAGLNLFQNLFSLGFRTTTMLLYGLFSKR